MKPKHLFLTRILNRHQNFELFQFLLVLFLILPQAIIAQVIIKEMVEIEPIQSPLSDNPANFDPSLCEPPVHEFVAPGDDETYSVWYGNCEEYGDCFTFIRDNVRPWNVSIVQGAEYVRVQISEEALCENWHDPGNNFVWDNACMYLVFDEQEPDSVATVKINFSSSAGNASYTYNVYKPYFHMEQMAEIDTMDFGGEEIIELLVLNQCNNTWPSISDTTTFSAEIIKGSQYGQLWNPDTDEYGISLSSLTHSYGYLPIYFEANQTNPEQNEEIIVRVKSFNEDIDSIDVSFYVRPFNLFITVNPPEIGPGETAQITAQRIHSDGTLEDFPEWQTFEVGMLDGCALGMIKTEADSGAYLYDVMQPIYFKADTGAVSGTVKLSVGYIRQIVSSSRNVRRDGNDLSSEKQEEERNRKITANHFRTPNTNTPPPTPENTENYCPGVNLTAPVKKQAEVVVGECDYPPYNPDSYILNYELLPHDNYYPTIVDDEAPFPITILIEVCDDPNDLDLKQLGGSKPVYYSKLRNSGHVNSWAIKPLIDEEDQLHFSIVDPATNENTTLKFDFVTGVCYFKINHPSHTPKTLIYNLTDLSDRQIIPDKNEALLAMQDFCGHHCYGMRFSKYAIIDVINLHELEHMNDYKDSCIVPNFQGLVEEIKKVTLACKFYDSQAKVNQTKLINRYIKDFISREIEHFNKINELATKGDFTYEKKLQKRPAIVNRIKDYTWQLSKEFKIIEPQNCTACP